MRQIFVVILCFMFGCDSSLSLCTDDVSESSTETNIVVLTESAAKAVREFMSADQTANAIKISVGFDDPTTCTGYRYNLALTTDPSPKEFVLAESHGIDIAIDVESVEFLRGTQIDWVPLSGGNEGFYFQNPNSDAPMRDDVRKHYESTEPSDERGAAESAS